MNQLTLLFDKEEHVCITSTVYGVASQPLKHLRLLEEFVCINPLRPGMPRMDANVACYRNILVEFDKGTIEEQKQLVLDSGLPFTTMTFSGNKSIHVIISLAEPLESRAQYDMLVNRIYHRFPTCDKSTKNPSRLSRTPGAVRLDNNAGQVLLEARQRVSNAELTAWLGEIAEVTPLVPREFRRSTRMRLNTMAFLACGAPEGSWNIELFKAAADLLRCGLPKDEIRERLEGVSGYLDSKDNQTIASAFRAVEREERSKSE